MLYTYVVHGMFKACTFQSINVDLHCSDMFVHVYTIVYAL